MAAACEEQPAGSFANHVLFDLITTAWHTDAPLAGGQEDTDLAHPRALP
ncbi:hypothetical protein [Streptomyces sp. RP5T]|nr:hypothetical protein [Streptomyces sp. RP5T]